MRSKTRLVLPMVMVAFVGLRLGAEEHGHGQEKPAHGGRIHIVGEEAAHLEVVHDAKAGTLVLFVLDKDAKAPLTLKDAPRINISAADGNRQLETKAVEAKDGLASQFVVTDDVLKTGHLSARVALTIGDKKYNVKLDDGHGH